MSERASSYKQHKKRASYERFAAELDTSTVSAALLPAVTSRFGPGTQVLDVAVEHLKKPVFTCTLRLSREGQPGECHWTVIAKKHADAEVMRESHRLLQELWRSGFADTAIDGIHTPEPVHLAEDIQFLFMALVPGEKLRRLLKRDPDNTGYMRQFARTLAKLHRSPIALEETITLRDAHAAKAEDYARLAEAFPGAGPAIEAIIQQSLRLEAALLGSVPLGPVHGTYNLGQLHVEGDRCWILDFDSMRRGDPAWDVANVLSDAMLNQEKSGLSNGRELLAAFRDEYFATMDPAIADRVPLYEAFYRLKRAAKYHRSQEPDRLLLVEGLVERAAEGLASLA